MRPAVMAAAFWFDPRLAWVRAPITGVARRAGGIVMRWLDQRRERLDQLH
jgi:hypothetical protein